MGSLIRCVNLLPPHVKTWLKEKLIHLKLYKERVRELQVGIQKLKKARDIVQHKVEEEEKRYGRGIAAEVKEWMERVDKIIFEYEEDFNDEERNKLVAFDLFTSGYLPKLGIRSCLSAKASVITRKVNGLLQTAKYDTLSYWLGPPSMTAFLYNIGYESFPSRDETMKKIKEALEDPSVKMIGLHGLSGVGKTTLVKEVAREALDAKMFDVVTMANVTRNPEMRKIQGQIADMLGMTLDEESDIARAAQIGKRLKNEKESTLIVLDDLWAKLDFNMLGIPFENDNDIDSLKNVKEGKSPGAEKHASASKMKKPEKLSSASNSLQTEETLSRYKGCKVFLISETKQVLLSQMEGKEKFIFSTEVLKEKEAETLFKKMAGIGDGNSAFEKLAAQIANKCNGVPMSIVTTARALKNQSRSRWEDALRKLEWQMLTGAPELSTRLSYDLLENDELKYTFLLCARMGLDALIMDLVKYCIGLGFLQGIYTVREARSRVYALVGRLKVSGLLSDSYSSDHFTMSDIVRSAALSIASEEKQHVFTMTKGKVDEWPDEDKLERYAAISLHHCDIIEGFPSTTNCPKLRVFHVNNNDPHLEIPEKLFEGMKELKVLILIGINLSPFPSSIRCLTKLRMLCLENCKLGEELSIIAELKKLRILSLAGSDVEKLPVELKHLTKLQIFDISNCYKLGEIPSNVISSLISLEELYMRNTLIQWGVNEQTCQSENASLSELKHLNQLTNLDIQIPNAAQLPKNLFFDKLYNYKIVIGDLNAFSEMDFKMPEKYETSRFLAIQLKDGFDIHSQNGIKMLFERVEHLFLEDLNGVKDIFYRLNLKGFPYLKHLLVVNNSNIQSLINPKERRHPEKAFPKLESLYLYNLKNLDKICSCKLSAPSFGKLKVIKINLCGKLENVFLIYVVRLLTVLETIEISECYALKEIVKVETQSNTNEIEVLKFPELRNLTLQSLSDQFIAFYPISSTRGEPRNLFNEKVVVSKLERMELSSIQIDKIWSDQPLLRSYFQNLIHLDVNGCWNLEYLISFPMAKSLENLQSLFVSECEKMTTIFPQRQGSHAKMKGSIFPNLKNIKISSMKSLGEIWNSELSSNSFGKLDTLIIEECDKFVNVFPCSMEGIFKSLCNLRVTNCRSMKVIFDLDDKKGDVGDVTNLQDVHLEALLNLEHVWKWNKDRHGILKLNNLQKMWVHDCDSLENIFPVSVAKCLQNLEYLVIWDCFELREIVAKGEGTNTNTSNPYHFVFPKLITIKFSKLPKLECFYPGAYELSCPALNDLSIELCDRLDPFRKETTDAQRRPTLFSEEVINKLKSMQIESWHAKSSSSYMGEGNHRQDNLEELCLSRLMNPEILYSFLYNNPNLKTLSLNNCSFTDIVPHKMPPEIENLGVVPNLKSLKLIDLPDLETIGFERDINLQRIEFLILKNCPCLVNIMPSSVSLTHLTNLEVVNCDGLEKLMPLSAAKSLVQLNSMKVMKCESMVEIIENEEENAGKVDIVLRQLKVLELVSLKNLNCFSKSCVFEFSSLEKLVVSACPRMENFSKEVKSTPLLQKIYVVHEKEKKRWCWKDDLKTTIQEIFKEKKFLEGMDEMSLSEHCELQQAWHGNGDVDLKSSWFYSLKTLKLENCEILLYAIPSNILPYLKSLKELEVRNCNKVKKIFAKNDTEEILSQLKNLTLEGLSDLTHVWEKNFQGNLTFQNLKQVSVCDCKNLKTLFPAALAKNLKKLEKLYIDSCQNLLEIIGKEEDVAADVAEKFVFPCLTWLDLHDLPELTYFYPEIFTVECPKLTNLFVLDCPKLELFQGAHPKGESESSSTSINRLPLFSDLKVIYTLEKLFLDWKHISVLRIGQHTVDLKYLNKIFFCFDVDETEKPTKPLEILEKAPNLQCMTIGCVNSPEIFLTPNPKNSEQGILGQLKILKLFQVFELQYVNLEHSWLNTACEKIHDLNVSNCPGLTKLFCSPSAVSFSYLKELCIKKCHGLNYLFTASVARVLVHLEEITVEESKSIKEIVAKEQDGTTSQGIEFERLYFMDLDSLSSLECFYSGNDTVQLPSLTQVVIWKCPKMEVFSRGEINVKSFRGIQDGSDSNELVFHNDLNASVKKVFLLQDHLVFRDSPLLEAIWLKFETVPDWCFCNLNSLVIEGCEFLSDAILPSHLLPFLSNLTKLEVRNCNSVKAIFVYTKIGPQGSLSLPFLEKLCVENCEELLEIVAKDESATEEANKEIIMFPRVTFLRLWTLNNLWCIYPGMHILEWPMLTELYVMHCPKLKFFATEFQSSRDSHLECQDSFPTNQQAFVSLEKITPRLKVLMLGKEEAKMIEQGKLHVDLQELDTLRLQRFHDKTDVFPFVFRSKASLPSMKKLVVRHSDFKEIFPSQTPDIDYTKILSQLKILELQSLSQLKSIGLEHSWIGPFLENLQTIHVLYCASLTNLTPSTVSFSNLIKLSVKNCGGLKYLFTSSTTKTLHALRELHIANCKLLKAIVVAEGGDEHKYEEEEEEEDEDKSKGEDEDGDKGEDGDGDGDEDGEGEGEDKDEIIFKELEILKFSSLPKLGSFYSGSSTLNFPSLKVSFSGCHNMKVFCSGEVVTGKLEVTIDGDYMEGNDINDVIKQWREEEEKEDEDEGEDENVEEEEEEDEGEEEEEEEDEDEGEDENVEEEEDEGEDEEEDENEGEGEEEEEDEGEGEGVKVTIDGDCLEGDINSVIMQ